MISVIIPTLNEEKIILKSLKQYYPLKKKFNLELIISDGGSTDNTVKIAKKYIDTMVIHREKYKQTIAEARNTGAKVAKGDIFVFIDSDVILPDPEKFFEKIKSNFEDKSIVAATSIVKIYPEQENNFDRLFHNFFSNWIKFLNKIKIGGGRGECQIVRADSFWKVHGYNESLAAGEDFDLFMRLVKKGKVIFFNDIIVYESPRRYRKEGYLKIISKWVTNYFFTIFLKKSYSKEWKPVR